VQVTAGTNAIAVISTDQNGAQHQASVSVTAVIQPQTVTLTATPNVGGPILKASGLATLDVVLAVTATLQYPVTVASYAWDFNGDGTDDLVCSSLASVTASYQYPGLYLATVTVTDTARNKYTDTVIVNVLASQEMSSDFNVIWNKTRTALANKDIEGALSNMTISSSDIYRYNFQVMQDILPLIAQDMRDIKPVKIGDNNAEFEMITTVDGGEHSFYVEFVRDVDGFWKLNFF
jgi:PKD repeat protein